MPRPDQATGPIYRFHGRHRPDVDARTPVVDTADVVSTTDGVATLRLYDPIDSWGGEWGVSAKEFARALDKLPEDTAEIRLHINSPGGEVYEGLAILNSLRNHKARVVAVIDGLAASAASFIATGADEVIMGKNTQLMIHDAWGLAIGNADDMRDMAGRLDKISDNIASVYASKTGNDQAFWRAAMLAESWYDADEAVAVGLADRIEGEADEEARNRFDLSIFKNAGRGDAPPPPTPESAPERDVEQVDTPAAPAVSDPAAYWQRRHRMNERKAALSA
jgi:ATP-dependent Clp endopeptidase proteolytic subunit ClpP